MSKVVLVLGVGRSGTSVVAGILHKLGVDMGGEFMESTASNKYGTFEEREFFHFNRHYINGTLDPSISPHEWSQDYVARRNARSDIWGLKEPMMIAVLPKFINYLGDDVRIVLAERNKLAVVNSYMFAYHTKESDAYDWYKDMKGEIDNFLDGWRGPLLRVDYDDLIDPKVRGGVVDRVAEFVFDEMPNLAVRYEAYQHIVERGQRFDREGKWIRRPSVDAANGWGHVAVGTRVSKYPEYQFFVSWSRMLTGGVRKGDKVLIPVGWMPAHWASNALARDFMRTDLDSLLMIDDDMVFDAGALESLRSNKDTWGYDVIFGFCTHKQWPPKPVIVREWPEQPELPKSLNGISYGYVKDFEDGDIVDVDAVGLAFTLIKRHVFEEMTGEYGPMYTFYFDYGNGRESDDMSFCQRAKRLGFKMAVDTKVKIGHIGQQVFGWDEFQMWKRQQSRPDVVEFDAAELMPILSEALPHLSDESKIRASNVLGIIGGGDGD